MFKLGFGEYNYKYRWSIFPTYRFKTFQIYNIKSYYVEYLNLYEEVETLELKVTY